MHQRTFGLDPGIYEHHIQRAQGKGCRLLRRARLTRPLHPYVGWARAKHGPQLAARTSKCTIQLFSPPAPGSPFCTSLREQSCRCSHAKPGSHRFLCRISKLPVLLVAWSRDLRRFRSGAFEEHDQAHEAEAEVALELLVQEAGQCTGCTLVLRTKHDWSS